MKTFLNYGKEYEVELKLKLKRATALYSGWKNILHITKGGDKEVGDRIPSVFVADGSFEIMTALNNDKDFYETKNTGIIDYDQLINISQRKIGDDYIYKITVNGETKHEVQNNVTQSFEKVDVYISNDFHNPIDDGDILIHHVKIYQWD